MFAQDSSLEGGVEQVTIPVARLRRLSSSLQIGLNTIRSRRSSVDVTKLTEVPATGPQPATVIAFTQSLAFSDGWDLLAMMRDGRIVEQGTQAELMAKKGQFWLMASNQASRDLVAQSPPASDFALSGGERETRACARRLSITIVGWPGG